MGSAAFERDVLVVDEAVEGVAALLVLLYDTSLRFSRRIAANMYSGVLPQ
jgi:hypothetical protein